VEDLLKWLWNKLKKHPSGWLVLLPLVFYAILEIVSKFSDLGFSEEVTKYRLYILPASLALAALIVLIWLLIVIIIENIKLEEKLNDLEDKEKALLASQQVILNLLEEVTARRKFEITKVQFYNDVIYLILSKKRTQNLTIGDEIKVLDTNDGSLMGAFQVCQDNQTEFRAEVSDYISPLWEGFIRQLGNAESSAPPNTMAILFK
jgi:hypothetical protein